MSESSRGRIAFVALAVFAALGGAVGGMAMLVLLLIVYGNLEQAVQTGSGEFFRQHLMQGAIAGVLGCIAGMAAGTRLWKATMRKTGLLTQRQIDEMWNHPDT